MLYIAPPPAEILGLSAEMVRVLHRDGLLQALRAPRGYRVCRRSDVERLAERAKR